jgi:hypothetical protein
MPLNLSEKPCEVAPSLSRRHTAPYGIKGFLRCCDRVIDIGLAAPRNVPDDLPGAGVHHVDGCVCADGPPLTTDEY